MATATLSNEIIDNTVASIKKIGSDAKNIVTGTVSSAGTPQVGVDGKIINPATTTTIDTPADSGKFTISPVVAAIAAAGLLYFWKKDIKIAAGGGLAAFLGADLFNDGTINGK